MQQTAPPIDETRITLILSGTIEDVRNKHPLVDAEWTVLLQAMAATLGCQSPTDNVDKGVEFLQRHFVAELIAKVEEAGTDNYQAWFALVLRFLMELHAGSKDNSKALQELGALVEAQSAAIADAVKHLTGTGGAPALTPGQQAQLDFCAGAIESLAADFPSLKAAAILTVALLPGIAADATTAATESAYVAEKLREGTVRFVGPATEVLGALRCPRFC